MTTAVDGKLLREGSAEKRSAILQAARDLFYADGFDRTSVDAVALRAGVSKRTVYDYYGDKRTLFLAVVQGAADSLMGSLTHAIDLYLSDSAGITGLDQLERALVAFSVRIATSTIGSSDYVALLKLVTADGGQLSELRESRMAHEPEDLIAERLAHYARVGLLEVPDPRLAADHFNALTFLLIFNKLEDFELVEDVDAPRIIIEGVRVFLRAYAAR